MSEINIYAAGLMAMSLCAPKDMSKEGIEHLANLEHPTGIPSQWKISEGETFADGTPMPAPCENDGGRLHWLLQC